MRLCEESKIAFNWGKEWRDEPTCPISREARCRSVTWVMKFKRYTDRALELPRALDRLYRPIT